MVPLEVLKIIFRRVGEEGVVDAVPDELYIGSHEITLLKVKPVMMRDYEMTDVRRYLENSSEYRRKVLLGV